MDSISVEDAVLVLWREGNAVLKRMNNCDHASCVGCDYNCPEKFLAFDMAYKALKKEVKNNDSAE